MTPCPRLGVGSFTRFYNASHTNVMGLGCGTSYAFCRLSSWKTPNVFLVGHVWPYHNISHAASPCCAIWPNLHSPIDLSGGISCSNSNVRLGSPNESDLDSIVGFIQMGKWVNGSISHPKNLIFQTRCRYVCKLPSFTTACQNKSSATIQLYCGAATPVQGCHSSCHSSYIESWLRRFSDLWESIS